MIDLTEEFFTEIYPKYREIARSINDDKVLIRILRETVQYFLLEENLTFVV